MNEQIFWLGINIYHEARSEPVAGQIAVGHVVMNRAEQKGMTVKEVVLKPFQFSWHNDAKFPMISEYSSLLDSFYAAEKVLEERLLGKTLQGANHYFADYIATPGWAAGMTRVCQIGKHIFFRDGRR